MLEVAAGAVKGASTIYMGLESAAAMLASSLTDNTVKVVTHKYVSLNYIVHTAVFALKFSKLFH